MEDKFHDKKDLSDISMSIVEFCTCLPKYKCLALRHLCQPLSLRPADLFIDKVIQKNNSSAITACLEDTSVFFYPLFQVS